MNMFNTETNNTLHYDSVLLGLVENTSEKIVWISEGHSLLPTRCCFSALNEPHGAGSRLARLHSGAWCY